MAYRIWQRVEGSRLHLGQLVFYRTKFQEKFKLSPNASPGLFGGWKIEFGFRYQGACKVIDYESLKKGKLSIMLVPDCEIYVREDIVFPLCELAEKALRKFSDAQVQDLGDIDSLPVPFVEDVPEILSKSRRVYITYRRILEIGSTPGCRGCEGDSSNHNSVCIARFEEAYGRDSAVPPSRGLEELEDVPDQLIQNDSDYEPSIRPHDPLDDDLVQECPPPSDDEGPLSDGPHEVEEGVGAVVSIASDFKNALLDDEIQNVFGVVLSQAARLGCPGATAMPSEVTKGRHASSGGVCCLNFVVMRTLT